MEIPQHLIEKLPNGEQAKAFSYNALALEAEASRLRWIAAHKSYVAEQADILTAFGYVPGVRIRQRDFISATVEAKEFVLTQLSLDGELVASPTNCFDEPWTFHPANINGWAIVTA